MARMGREFSLVLLGASMLTAGYFLWPEDDVEKRAEEQAAHQLGGRSHHAGHLIFLHSASSSARSVAARSSVSRGGFGATGRGFSGGA